MRYEPEHKAQTRDRIVRNAARKLRAEGLSGPGVASVMKASGLTVGGFYKHFRSKDASRRRHCTGILGYRESLLLPPKYATRGKVEGNRSVVPLPRAL
jgi:AcrR family transcriptional regulator